MVGQPLRILIVLDVPWDPRLGAARVGLSLFEQWKKAGHQVQKYSLGDAFPRPTQSGALSNWRQAIFAYRAARFIRRHAENFDVIDCMIGTLPFSKRSLGFRGLFVGRSIGLHLEYDKFLRFSRKRWPDKRSGKFIGHVFYYFTSSWRRRHCDDSLRYCDLFNVANEDEKRLLEQVRPGIPVIVLPYGVTDYDRAAFGASARPAGARLAGKEICFLGMWSARKGSRDWPEIIRAILKSAPDTRFAFLGTMTDEKTVLRDLQPPPSASIRCLTSYDPEELPRLIANCAVGLFPSYVEGFGMSVIEQLSAGIPTIAYDVPGPRHILRSGAAELLVPAGDVAAMSRRAVELLQMNETAYGDLSARCRAIAGQFRWEQIATDTIREYRAAIDRQNRNLSA